MSLLLYINGQLAELDAGQSIAQTKQVNDLNSPDNRQTSYTNKFKLPKTATNIRIMDYLTLTGNNSAVPYQKNQCSLFSDTGECFVYNGWAVISDGGDDYEAVIYDGIVSLYKAIENKTLADLQLAADLNHTKNMANVTASWTNPNAKYKYIMANYNGATTYPSFTTGNQSVINIDNLVPSVSVSWLWQKIFATYGFTYSGAIFSNPDFTNLWVTYPKGVTTQDLNISQLETSSILFFTLNTGGHKDYYAAFTQADVNTLESANSNIFWQVAQTGTYRIDVSGKIRTSGPNTKISLVKNTASLYPGPLPAFATIIDNLPSNEEFSSSVAFTLQAHDSVALVIKSVNSSGGYYLHHDDCELDIKLVQVAGTQLDFQTAFANFSTRDFINEVIYRFGLTLFKRKYDNHYDFLTLQEQLQTPDVQNWSSKFVRKTAEKYVFSNYAQQNFLRYAYNNKDDSYCDFSLDVPNENLDDTKDIFKSKIYAPQREQETYLGSASNVYKMWDKEVSTDSETNLPVVTYKALDNRYYFLRSALKPLSPAVKIGSKAFGTETMISSCPVESFSKLSFMDIVQDYYSPLEAITNNAQVITADLWLTEADVANFDFKKLYYIEQLAAYFIMNKINNYIAGKATQCELVRVAYSKAYQPFLTITRIERNGLQTVTYFSHNLGNQNFMLQWHQGSNVWNNATGSTVSPIALQYPFAGTFYVRLWCNSMVSNTITITLPSNQTVYA